ncbi:uncharacterized protein Z519_03599 [Cladophialophora bantiana CBS 173.52]|uniref:Glyoxalase/fosfomycin resistance/dioxygenase domain-containing protein n=1 Tax=Cladophialophora bantiana (strain ATCC 10958 / CBS 173.52 / CDC B-1940 / NIH 8579) TaxID=1442370 RepID=A0A0D2I064_CLAB1|nr:uncharacterized protein Z519_03599 [Cladophialophora bantiana CBS 173.52]KIW96530.1 hypothetical protein Z519_03599 [Cladophialophora bantiana CBS 173.52]
MAAPPESSAEAGITLVSILVHSYGEALAFFIQKLGFILAEDLPSLTTTGKPKRWVVVHPPPSRFGSSGILLAQADGPEQTIMVGK